jgi:ubiquinone/menaquinone biosynthesis C-methylase UbiE
MSVEPSAGGVPANTWDVFDKDAAHNAGYLYTATSRLSCRLATQRSTDVVLSFGRFSGKRVIDLGCGDGFYSIRFWDQAHPLAWTGLDAAPSAVAIANEKKGSRPMEFEVGDIHRVRFPNDSFDVALIMGTLHHDDDVQQTLREAFRVAREVIIQDPNGNNLGLKVIEKTSRYHIEHGEKSYPSPRLRRWIEAAGGRVTKIRFAGFVPMFSPDWMAKLTKRIEPVIEFTPGLKALGSAIYVVHAARA